MYFSSFLCSSSWNLCIVPYKYRLRENLYSKRSFSIFFIEENTLNIIWTVAPWFVSVSCYRLVDNPFYVPTVLRPSGIFYPDFFCLQLLFVLMTDILQILYRLFSFQNFLLHEEELQVLLPNFGKSHYSCGWLDIFPKGRWRYNTCLIVLLMEYHHIICSVVLLHCNAMNISIWKYGRSHDKHRMF